MSGRAQRMHDDVLEAASARALALVVGAALSPSLAACAVDNEPLHLESASFETRFELSAESPSDSCVLRVCTQHGQFTTARPGFTLALAATSSTPACATVCTNADATGVDDPTDVPAPNCGALGYGARAGCPGTSLELDVFLPVDDADGECREMLVVSAFSLDAAPVEIEVRGELTASLRADAVVLEGSCEP